MTDLLYVAGQSIAARFLYRGKGAFQSRVGELAPDLGSVHLTGLVRGGTVSSSDNPMPKTEAPAERRPWWWNADTATPGPVLELALEHIATLGRRRYEALVFDLGQHEAVWRALGTSRSLAEIRASYAQATPQILGVLRSALRPNAPETLPILFVTLGPMQANPKIRYAPEFGPFRSTQYEVVRGISNCHAVGSVRQMELEDWVHPSQAGVDYYAAKVAEKYVWLRRRDAGRGDLGVGNAGLAMRPSQSSNGAFGGEPSGAAF